MHKNTFLLILMLWAAQIMAAPVISATNSHIEALNCNLPAPQNLHTTSIGPNSLSFAWDVVAGSNGYDYELWKVSTNQLISTGHVPDEAYAATGLESGTLYEVRIWSVCSLNGQRGGVSLKQEATNYIIIDDVLVNFPAIDQSNNAPWTIFENGSTHAYFKVKLENEETMFDVEKVFIPIVNGGVDDYISHVKHGNGESSTWFLGNQNGIIPNSGAGTFASVEADFAYVYHDGGRQAVGKITITKNTDGSGTSKVSWQLLSGQYRLSKVDPPSSRPGVRSQTTYNNAKNIDSRSTPVLDAPSVLLSPNPFSDLLLLQRSSEQPAAGSVRVFDLNGREVLSQSFGEGQHAITVATAALQSGMYVVRYETADTVKTFKVFKAN